MGDSLVENLIYDLLEWISLRERTYQDVMEAWRTSCPKLPVWEDANDRGFVTIQHISGRRIVSLTTDGKLFLQQRKNSSESNTKEPR